VSRDPTTGDLVFLFLFFRASGPFCQMAQKLPAYVSITRQTRCLLRVGPEVPSLSRSFL
jgi:hypothetical protein